METNERLGMGMRRKAAKQQAAIQKHREWFLQVKQKPVIELGTEGAGPDDKYHTSLKKNQCEREKEIEIEN